MKSKEELQRIIINLSNGIREIIKVSKENNKNFLDTGWIVRKYIQEYLLEQEHCMNEESCIILASMLTSKYIVEAFPAISILDFPLK